MTDFIHLSTQVEGKFKALSAKELFLVDDDALWEAYLLAFPEGTNPIFRKNTVHECSCCRQFVKTLGRAVEIRPDGSYETVWDLDGTVPEPYRTVAKAMSERVRSRPIQDLFRTKEPQYGAAVSREMLEDGTAKTWNHFVGRVAGRHMSNAVSKVKGEARTCQDVLFRSLVEVDLTALDTVVELIKGKQIYRGAEFEKSVRAFRVCKEAFDAIDEDKRQAWSWLQSATVGLSGFKNSAIGSLVWDLSTGVSLQDAVRMFESKVAPAAYKRPTALVTQKMIDEALATITDLGVEKALYRRHARLSDVAASDVLFVDNDVKGKMKDGIAAILVPTVRTEAFNTANAQDIDVGDFIAEVVPKAKTMRLLVENRHLGNFVSLTAPVYDDVKSVFKWGNNFAWSYDGDVTDSIKEKVKKAGGDVTGRFRISLAWHNTDDLDLHVREPSRNTIYHGARQSQTGGWLDVDMNVSRPVRNAVENVRWKDKVPVGEYIVTVRNYTKRETVDVGFELEVEFDGVIHNFSYPKAVAHQTDVKALVITVGKAGLEGIEACSGVNGGEFSASKWGLDTGHLAPVELFTLSPNHWGDHGTGQMHWIFALQGCKNPDKVRGIYNEFLRPDLEVHRKVFELLGSKTKCDPAEDQISGVGFTSARGDSAVVVVGGSKGSRAYNVKF